MTVSEGRPVSMRVVRLRAPGGLGQLAVEESGRPRPGPGEELVRVHAAAVTRDELQWPVDHVSEIAKGNLATVGRTGAVADIKGIKLSGSSLGRPRCSCTSSIWWAPRTGCSCSSAGPSASPLAGRGVRLITSPANADV